MRLCAVRTLLMYRMRALSNCGDTKASTSCVALKMPATQKVGPKALLRACRAGTEGREGGVTRAGCGEWAQRQRRQDGNAQKQSWPCPGRGAPASSTVCEAEWPGTLPDQWASGATNLGWGGSTVRTREAAGAEALILPVTLASSIGGRCLVKLQATRLPLANIATLPPPAHRRP